ncbi:362_t:CDS:2, partial [Acaulospora colombiana]
SESEEPATESLAFKRRKKEYTERNPDLEYSYPGDDVFIFKDDLDTFMSQLKDWNERLEKYDNGRFQLPADFFRSHIEPLKQHKYDKLHELEKQIEEVIADHLKKVDREAERLKALSIKIIISNIEQAWKSFLEAIYRPMAPSKFAKSAGWFTVQHGPAAINCLRPPECSRIPIALLHSAFTKFIYTVNQPMPFKTEFTDAYKAAWELCLTMPGLFKDKKQRKSSLNKTINSLLEGEFPGFTQKRLGNADPDGLLLAPDGSVNCIMEIKNEPGSAGDVYMQSSCSYDAIARHAPTGGKPGPSILFCGGYRDGIYSVVEPLSRWCSMLPDQFGERQEVLAKHLYAFKLSLRSLFNDSAKYRGSESEVLVKIVRGPYGVDAHRFAAENGFAPRLYGVANVDGAPPAYIMEFLSEDQGWLPLQKAFFHIKREEDWGELASKAREFLFCMKNQQLVHGDLRANNTLFRLGDNGIDLRVLDWDWSGTAATVRYPMDRNPQAGLLGTPGGFIHSNHDAEALSEQLKQVAQPPIRS